MNVCFCSGGRANEQISKIDICQMVIKCYEEKIKQDKRIESDRPRWGQGSRYVFVRDKSIPEGNTGAKASKPYLMGQEMARRHVWL